MRANKKSSQNLGQPNLIVGLKNHNEKSNHILMKAAVDVDMIDRMSNLSSVSSLQDIISQTTQH